MHYSTAEEDNQTDAPADETAGSSDGPDVDEKSEEGPDEGDIMTVTLDTDGVVAESNVEVTQAQAQVMDGLFHFLS